MNSTEFLKELNPDSFITDDRLFKFYILKHMPNK